MSADTKHTEEPWVVDCGYIYSQAHEPLLGSVQVLSKDDGTETANLERAAACVNACAGLNPSAVPGLVEAVEDKIRLGHEEGCTGPYKSQSIEIKCNCGITKLSTALAAAKKVEGE